MPLRKDTVVLLFSWFIRGLEGGVGNDSASTLVVLMSIRGYDMTGITNGFGREIRGSGRCRLISVCIDVPI